MKILDESDFNDAFIYGSDVYLLETTKKDQGFFKRRKHKKLKKAVNGYLTRYHVDTSDDEKKVSLINTIEDQTIMNVALAGYYSTAIRDDLKQAHGDVKQVEKHWLDKLAADLPDNPGYAKIAFDEICAQSDLSDDEKAVQQMAKKAFEDTYGHLKQGQF